nr:MAG TPA: hypothetical protein [Bacteriophage sp.]DAP77793.1 MAG TPA: hypothetical protein [Caudoviricetes sp.]
MASIMIVMHMSNVICTDVAIMYLLYYFRV